MEKYRMIKNVKPDNFLFGGLIYHHKEIIDPDKRNEEFDKMLEYKENGRNIKTVYDKTLEVNDIYSLAAEIQNIKNSQSLSQYAMQKTMDYFINEDVEYPIDEIYDSEEHNNTFINKGIKIIKSDTIIFIPHKGILGDLFSIKNDKQKYAIRYKFDEDLGINVGEVFDLKLIEDFLEYFEYIGDLK